MGKGLSEEDSLDLGFECRVGIFRRPTGSRFQADGTMKLNECSPYEFMTQNVPQMLIAKTNCSLEHAQSTLGKHKN